jgi:hypothetical protein
MRSTSQGMPSILPGCRRILLIHVRYCPRASLYVPNFFATKITTSFPIFKMKNAGVCRQIVTLDSPPTCVRIANPT